MYVILSGKINIILDCVKIVYIYYFNVLQYTALYLLEVII